jgi:trans-2,3-dihydro-3-hydroxyanthranilate isomerase
MPQRRYRFVQLDVFTDRAFGGNQLAVFPAAEGLTDAQMQAIAREMNYSESTFVLPPTDPDALCRVRIFTPAAELPFAGHPTVGTAVALVRERGIAPGPDGQVRLLLELGVGTLPVDVQAGPASVPFAWMHQPRPAFEPWRGDPSRLAATLGLTPTDLEAEGLPLECGSAGVPFLYVPIRSLAAIGRARAGTDLADLLDASACRSGAYLFCLETQTAGAVAHARLFAPGVGVTEDPATGSAAGPLGAYLFRHGRITLGPDGIARARVEQGLEMQRPSRLEVEVEGTPEAVRAVRVGGHAVLVAEGELLLDEAPAT